MTPNFFYVETEDCRPKTPARYEQLGSKTSKGLFDAMPSIFKGH